MRLTLEIPDAHTPALLEFLAELVDCGNRAKERITEHYTAEREGIMNWLMKAEPQAAATEPPMPDDLPKFPPLPAGKTRWVYLGIFSDDDMTGDAEQCVGRELRYWSNDRMEWMPTNTINGAFHHIEAI